LVQVGQSTPIVLSLTPPTGITAVANTYYAQPPHNVTAVVSTGSNGQISIQVNLPQGKTITLTQTSSTSSSGSSSSIFSSWTSSSSPSTSSSAIQLQTGTVFIDPSGNNITVFVNSDGSQSLQLVQISQPNYPTILTLTPPSGTTAVVNTYYAQPPSLMTATVITDSNGQTAIQINLAGGQTIVFSQQGSAAVSTQSNNSGITSTQYYGSTGSPYQTGASAMSYNGAYGGSAGSATGPYGNTAYYAQGPYGNTAAGTSSPNSSQYYSSLPPGIPASQIPSGQEDLYILKSQVVPPVCPVCPASNSSSSNDPDSAPKCQPCPPCGRCPEPSFECKKVPNYNAINNSYLPQPIINDFSSFGM
jgi:membrane-bound inhibitor of C-type lysozyme